MSVNVASEKRDENIGSPHPLADMSDIPSELAHPFVDDYHTDLEITSVLHDKSPESPPHALRRFPSSESLKEQEAVHPLESYATTIHGLKFLMHDSGINDANRILFFATEHNINILRESAFWTINCINKMVPRPFIEMWMIHGLYEGKLRPLAYFLLRTKKDENFARIVNILRITPTNLIMDNRRNEFHVAQTLFSGTTFHLCYFFFSSEITRIMASFHWRTLTKNDPELGVNLKCFRILAFVKPTDVIRYYFILKEMIKSTYSAILGADRVEAFYNYIEETWIGSLDGEENPKYPVRMWNVYDSTLRGYPRTNNAYKTWLARYYDVFRRIRPADDLFVEPWYSPVSVHKFIDFIILTQNMVESEVDRHRADMESRRHHKQNDDILKIVQDYDKYEPLEYLRNISRASYRRRIKH